MAKEGNRKNDPQPTFMFGLKIKDLSLDYEDGTAFFKSVSGLSWKTDAQDYPEGGVTAFNRKVIGVTKWDNIVLKQGFTGDQTLWSWRDAPFRVSGSIYQLGADLKPVCRWDFENGYPVKWEGPDYDASKNDMSIETVEIAHEGLTMVLEGDAPEDEDAASESESEESASESSSSESSSAESSASAESSESAEPADAASAEGAGDTPAAGDLEAGPSDMDEDSGPGGELV